MFCLVACGGELLEVIELASITQGALLCAGPCLTNRIYAFLCVEKSRFMGFSKSEAGRGFGCLCATVLGEHCQMQECSRCLAMELSHFSGLVEKPSIGHEEVVPD